MCHDISSNQRYHEEHFDLPIPELSSSSPGLVASGCAGGCRLQICKTRALHVIDFLLTIEDTLMLATWRASCLLPTLPFLPQIQPFK
jgi:hypothetical protein